MPHGPSQWASALGRVCAISAAACFSMAFPSLNLRCGLWCAGMKPRTTALRPAPGRRPAPPRGAPTPNLDHAQHGQRQHLEYTSAKKRFESRLNHLFWFRWRNATRDPSQRALESLTIMSARQGAHRLATPLCNLCEGAMSILFSLSHIGYTVPPQADGRSGTGTVLHGRRIRRPGKRLHQ